MNPIKDFANKIEPYLLEVFDKEAKEIPSSFKSAHFMLENIKYFCIRGGKKLRPALVYYGYKIFGKRDYKDILKASLITELLHAFLLIHDDIMDRDDTRRGNQTIHKFYEQRAIKSKKKKEDAVHFGESMGILAGDLCHSIALRILSSLKIDERVKLRILEEINKTIIKTIFGQELDIRIEFEGRSKTKEIMDVYRLKTAQYTFETPLHIGAILAGVSPAEFKKLSSYAVPCGIAFQIKDDVLGMFSNQKILGKPVASDLKQGKQTLLIAKALEKGTKAERRKLRSFLGNKNLSNKDVILARSIIKNTGALIYCENLSQKYIKRAKEALKGFSSNKYNQSIVKKLNSIADFIIKRKN